MRAPLSILALQLLAWFAYPWLLALSKISRAVSRIINGNGGGRPNAAPAPVLRSEQCA
jgi:hypothetical protein